MSKADLTLGYTEVTARVWRPHNKMTKNSPGDDKGQGQISPFFFSSCCSEFRTRDVYLFKDKGQIINNDVSWPLMARLVGYFSKKKKKQKKNKTQTHR